MPAPVSFCDVVADGDGSPPHLPTEAIAFLRRQLPCQLVDIFPKFARKLVKLKIFQPKAALLHDSVSFTTHHSPLTTHHSPLTTHHSPLTTHHSPLTTHHPPPPTPHSPPHTPQP